jgi:uncharacterized protein YegL
MKQGLVELVMILDRSGSMAGLEKDTIKGYNEFINNQLKKGLTLKVTTILFDDQYEVLYYGIDASKAGINEQQYFTRGTTALLDAVGKTINEVGIRLSKTNESDRPEKVIVMITTDGYENASIEFNGPQIKKMIEHQRDVYNWEFVFFGANINTEEVADDLGIEKDYAYEFTSDAEGIKIMMNKASNVVSDMIIKKEFKKSKG